MAIQLYYHYIKVAKGEIQKNKSGCILIIFYWKKKIRVLVSKVAQRINAFASESDHFSLSLQPS